MKRLVTSFGFFALIALLFIGSGMSASSAYADAQPIPGWNWDTGSCGVANCDTVYASQLCPGVAALFNGLNGGPIGCLDVENKQEIVGYEIWCDDEMVMDEFEGWDEGWSREERDALPHRDIPRGFGTIRVFYRAPQPPPK